MTEYNKGNIKIEVDNAEYCFRITTHGNYHTRLTRQDLIDFRNLSNELLETHTVKEPLVDCSWCRSQMPISADTPIVFHLYGCPNKNTPPSNSEKEEVKEQPTTPEEPKFGAFVIYEEDGFMTLERYGYFKMAKQDEESLKELLGYLKQYFEPTTPEKKIHCFDCGAQTMKDCVHHKETDAPEKKCHCTCTHEGFCSESHKEKL